MQLLHAIKPVTKRFLRILTKIDNKIIKYCFRSASKVLVFGTNTPFTVLNNACIKMSHKYINKRIVTLMFLLGVVHKPKNVLSGLASYYTRN